MFDFYYTDHTAVESSLAKDLYYNEQNQELAFVTHDNGTMVYEGVPYSRYAHLTQADSVGRVYNRFVKGKYTNKHGFTVSHVAFVFLNPKEEEKEEVGETKTFTVRAYVEFDAQVTASSLEEAIALFRKTHDDVDGIKIKEVVVPFEQ